MNSYQVTLPNGNMVSIQADIVEQPRYFLPSGNVESGLLVFYRKVEKENDAHDVQEETTEPFWHRVTVRTIKDYKYTASTREVVAAFQSFQYWEEIKHD